MQLWVFTQRQALLHGPCRHGVEARQETEAGAVHSFTLVKDVRLNAAVLPGVASVRDQAESPAGHAQPSTSQAPRSPRPTLLRPRQGSPGTVGGSA